MAARRNFRHILVVEDDRNTVDIIIRALSGRDWRVTMSLTMENALKGFGHSPCDLVVTDIFMKGMGGIEGIQRMREIRPDIKILATSAGFSEMSSEATLKAAEKIGADAVIPKPFSLSDLRNAVSQLLGDDESGEATS